VPTAISCSLSTRARRVSPYLSTVVTWSASTRWRSRAGITWRTVARARSAPSSIPVTVVVAVCSATATAIAWSSSNSSGGSSAPASRR
jgi:hypothetical protein